MRKTAISNKETFEIRRVAALLRQVDETVRLCRGNELKKFNISPEQCTAVTCIHFYDNKATQNDIAKWSSRKPSTITALIRRMEKQGLVTKTVDPVKKNTYRVALTPKGYEIYKLTFKSESIVDIFKVLPKSKRDQLWSLLQTLMDQAYKNLHSDEGPFDFELFDRELTRLPK
jgi:DNA-binding MarR family transcriptional regulator